MSSHKKSASVASGRDATAADAGSRVGVADAERTPRAPGTADIPRHRVIYEKLLAEIQSGVYKPGERLPSEAILCERFQASRITVAKAFQSLQRENLVTRRPGSGTYVEKPSQGSALQFGLLIPDLGTTDIFEAICQGILRSPAARSHSLTWGSTTGHEANALQAAEQLCQQYIAQRVTGVFFAPTEFSENRDESNHHLAYMLERAGIPVVLLDRDFEHFPDRSNFDLVGIDNNRAGYMLTRHLLDAGARRIVFAMRERAASTVEARAAGYRDALYSLEGAASPVIFSGDFGSPGEVKRMLERDQPDGIVCANDVTAARLMQTLVSLGVRIPGDIRMAGLDDVSYAKFLPTPLTTIRQNGAEIGAIAMSTMLDRLSNPDGPIRDILVRCDLIVRASSGASLTAEVGKTGTGIDAG
jgi:DNA-binding LacI/PurR family transcriptional regulator